MTIIVMVVVVLAGVVVIVVDCVLVVVHAVCFACVVSNWKKKRVAREMWGTHTIARET